jgi:hypothetical protein
LEPQALAPEQKYALAQVGKSAEARVCMLDAVW